MILGGNKTIRKTLSASDYFSPLPHFQNWPKNKQTHKRKKTEHSRNQYENQFPATCGMKALYSQRKACVLQRTKWSKSKVDKSLTQENLSKEISPQYSNLTRMNQNKNVLPFSDLTAGRPLCHVTMLKAFIICCSEFFLDRLVPIGQKSSIRKHADKRMRRYIWSPAWEGAH